MSCISLQVLILASASVGRKNLLHQAGIAHQVIISEIDEQSFCEKDPLNLVKTLSLEKAKAVSEKIKKGKIQTESLIGKSIAILGCDSVFEFEGEVFGKPADKEEALNRWGMM